jgi:hypothetical protein
VSKKGYFYMDFYGGTAEKVLHALIPYKLKRERTGHYRSNSPFRPQSDSMGFVLHIEDPEHGTFIDHVSGESGSLYDLADRLDISLPDKSNPSNNHYHNNTSHLTNKQGLTLAEFSEYKKIPIDFLLSLGIKQVIGKFGLPEIRIPYFNLDGSLFRERIRYALRAKDGSAWADGQGLIPFGLERIAPNKPFTIFFEGESDPITAWLYDFPALGIPGASSCNCLQAQHIQSVNTIYYLKEPDKGGETFAKKLTQRLVDIGFSGECFEITLNGFKDLSEVYLKDKDNFSSTLSAALENPTPINLPLTTSKVEIIESSDDLDLEELTPWPSPIGKSALHGVAGEIIEAIEPHTEADPAAMLMQFLTCFGSLIGRNAYFVLDGSKHFTNLFLIVVGASATGRKGTSFQHVKNLLNTIDSNWVNNCIAEGLSSGEGLIYTVRDPVYSVGKEGNKIISDLGCEDKRLTTVESEFMNTLGVMTRQGNTLSAMIRRAWNGETLATLTKNSPLRATDPHISLIGHITKNEYLKGISKTETSNGFVNRFLHCASKRSKSLPIGGKLHTVDFVPIIQQLHNAVEFARSTNEMKMDKYAIELWRDNYEHLVGEGKRTGLLAEVTARATGHVVRMAMIYSLLDLSNVITPIHLDAALECWRYAEDSAKYVFGNTASDPIAEQIFKALKSNENGLTQNQLRDLFSRNISSSRIKVALSLLLESGHIGLRKEKLDNGCKKPTIFWFVLNKALPN